MADELIEDIEKRGSGPVWGVGHSLGGVITLWASVLRPDLFQEIILLDPPLMGWKRRLFTRIFSPIGLLDRMVPIIRNARNRRKDFSSREEAFEYWQPKPFFKNFDPKAFRDYVEHGLKENNDGTFELVISPKLEAQIFTTSPRSLNFGNISTPCHYVYAQNRGVLIGNEIEEHKKRWPMMTFIPYAGSHMFPLEEPEKVGELIRNLIEKK